MKVGVQSIVEMVLLQIPASIEKALRVRMVNHHDCIVYAEHVLLHHLILFLLNLVQCPYHGIIVMFVTKVFSMCISRSCTEISLPLPRVQAHLPGYPWRLAKICGCILTSSYFLRKASTLKCQSVYVTSTPRSVNLKICISNQCRSQALLLPTPSVAPALMPMACSLTCSGVTIRVWCSPVW